MAAQEQAAALDPYEVDGLDLAGLGEILVVLQFGA